MFVLKALFIYARFLTKQLPAVLRPVDKSVKSSYLLLASKGSTFALNKTSSIAAFCDLSPDILL